MDSTTPPGEQAGIFWDNGIWRTRLAADNSLGIEFFDVKADAWCMAAKASPDFSTGKLLIPAPLDGTTSVHPLYHPQDRAMILGRICHIGGVMMHSSSVLVDGKVMVFTGVSGAGKTTMARLWRSHGGTILNDERTLIHNRGGTVLCGASPWHGEENQVNPATGPLSGIFFLKQAAENHLRLLPIEESIPRMLTTAFVPVFIPGGTPRTLDACVSILQTIPAYELSFTPDARALDLCRSVL